MKLFRYLKLFFIVAFISLFLSVSAREEPQFIPLCNKGYLDLTHWDFAKNGAVNLDGEWEFYWKKLLEPTDFQDTLFRPDRLFSKVPSSWTKIKVDSINLPYEGYGTYRLVIETDTTGQYYALRINDVFTNYKLWINGTYYGEMGKVGKAKSHAIPKYYSKEFPVLVKKDTLINKNKIEIILQASNFHHLKAGIKFPMYFGTHDALIKNLKNSYILNLIIIGIIFIIGLNHMIHFVLRRNDRSNLYFGILCLVMILRNITTNDRIISYWFSDINWNLLVKLDNFSGFGTIPFFALFLFVIFKADFPKLALYLLVGVGSAIALLIFSTPVTVFNKYQMIFELYVLTGGLYLTFYVLFKASIKRREGAFLTFIGFVILYSTAINDVLSNMGVIDTAYVAPYGLVTYMIIQSFILNRRSAKALQENEKLGVALKNEKDNLQAKIQERTEELFTQNRELIKLRRKEERRNWYNEGYALLSDILNKEKENSKQLSEKILSALLIHMEAQIGLIYLLQHKDGQEILQLTASYGADMDGLNKKEILPGESLVGTCFNNNKTTVLSEIPDNFIKIGSGMGEAKPYSLALIPLKLNDKATGVIEIGSFKKIQDYEIELIERISSNLASTINNLRVNEKSAKILTKFTDLEIDLKQKEIEIRKQQEEIIILKEKMNNIKL